MSIEFEQQPLAPRIAALLSALRLRIRGYVWTEGLAAIVVYAGHRILAIAGVRLAVRAAVAVARGNVGRYRRGGAVGCQSNILRRVFRPIDDTNLAVVLERRFPDYQDSLLTTVELVASDACLGDSISKCSTTPGGRPSNNRSTFG